MSFMRLPNRLVAAAAVGCAVAAGAVGCSASGTSSSSPAGGPAVRAPQQGGAPPGGGAAQGDSAQGGAAAKPGQPIQIIADSRSIIFTGTITVRVPDVNRAAADATTLATAAGGFVGGDDRSSGKDSAQARMILRVPSDRFTPVVDGVGKLGKEESRQLSSEDVTDQVTDVDARIATGQASVDRVRALMAKAQNIGDIVSLESELSRREADLESLKSRKNKLADQVTLSTITAVLLGPQAAGPPPPRKHQTGFVAGLKAGWHSFAASMAVLFTVLGALLPWLVALGVPAAAVLWWLRRTRRPAPASTSAD
jgi:Domain of unknown function (DUF4349)